MQPDQPLLTIAIPTYNREKYLKILLSILEPQVLNEPRLELIVSDNASIDGTESLVQAYSGVITGFRYIKNKTNLGADGNILQCFEQARGKYVWILGDDDVVAPDAVRRIMACLESGEYDLVYVSSFSFEGDHAFEEQKEYRKPSEIRDVLVFVRRINVMFTFISGNIVNKTRVLEVQHSDLTSLVGTSLVQLGWMYAALNEYRCSLYIHEKLVGGRSSNTGGYRLFQAFGPNIKAITERRLHEKALQRLILNGTLMRFWPAMLINYRLSSSAFEREAHPREMLGPTFRSNFRYWIFVYPILNSPSLFAKTWLLFTRILNKLDKSLGYPLMR